MGPVPLLFLLRIQFALFLKLEGVGEDESGGRELGTTAPATVHWKTDMESPGTTR